MLDGAEGFADFFRGTFPYYLLIIFPTLILFSPNVVATNEFSVARMSQFDLYGNFYGCRASALNMEAKSLFTWSTSRHCIVARLQDITIDQYKEIRAKAGGLVILLPNDFAALSFEEKQQIRLLEQAMLQQDIAIPVYFSHFNPQLDAIVNDISRTTKNTAGKKRESALTEIAGTISANGYQIVVSGASHAANKQAKIPIIQGELVKPIAKISDSDSKLPLVLVTAHLNTFGLINQHLSNYDVTILLALVDLFSKLNTAITTSPKYRLMFVVSESGSLLNFQGIKKWLDVNIDENALSQNPEFVICLDSLGRASDNLFMHVSKPPKEGSQISNFFKSLKTAAETYGNSTVEGIHKKVNLADVNLAWEHERFSMKRLTGLTISNLKNHKDPLRVTMFEDKDSDLSEVEQIQANTKIVAEALGRYIYDIKEGEIFTGTMAVTRDVIKPWLNIQSTMHNNDLQNAFEKYLKNVKVTHEKPDPREPDFMLYGGHDAKLNIYNVKPAIFDLFLTTVIAGYLFAIYFGILYFPNIYTVVCKLNLCSGSSQSTLAANHLSATSNNSNGKSKVY